MPKILLTGANGFLGRSMQRKWHKYYEIITMGRTENAMITCDLSHQIPVIPPIDMVVHASGKAHVVPKTIEEKKDFFDINVQGTKNLLTALENSKSLKKFVFISSVAVYGLTEGTDVKEDTILLATDPYGKSKIIAEKLIVEWCGTKNIDWYILRLPLIAGKSAPGNLGAMVKGIKSGRYLSIGKAEAKKSMILADDLAKFIPNLQGPSGVYNLTDGYHPSFKELENKISKFYGKKHVLSLPAVFAKILGFTGDIIGTRFPVNSDRVKKITSTLTFNDTRARALLKWKPNEVLKTWEIE